MCKYSDKIKTGTDREAHEALLGIIKEQGETLKEHNIVLMEVRDSVKGMEQKFHLLEAGSMVLPHCKEHNQTIKELDEKIDKRTIAGLCAILGIVFTGIVNYIVGE